jgi:hypothetical protein
VRDLTPTLDKTGSSTPEPECPSSNYEAEDTVTTASEAQAQTQYVEQEATTAQQFVEDQDATPKPDALPTQVAAVASESQVQRPNTPPSTPGKKKNKKNAPAKSTPTNSSANLTALAKDKDNQKKPWTDTVPKAGTPVKSASKPPVPPPAPKPDTKPTNATQSTTATTTATTAATAASAAHSVVTQNCHVAVIASLLTLFSFVFVLLICHPGYSRTATNDHWSPECMSIVA